MKKIVYFSLLAIAISLSSCNGSKQDFIQLFNGKDWTGWYLKIRSGDSLLAEKVYAIEDGMVHVFNDEFADSIEVNTGVNATHGLFYTEKEYSRFIFKFEYKWGKRIANDFDKWQYDAGFYYHVIDDRIWPKGLEYQVVFLPDCNEGKVPHKKATTPEEIEEERRMFYVAMTRAKEQLEILFIEDKFKKHLQKSRFLK